MKVKLQFSTRQIKVKYKLLFLYILIIVYSFNAIPISGATKEFIGQYEITAYLDNAFSGKTTISQDSLASSLTTSFGTYTIGYVTHFSDVRLSHTSQGYISISDWNSYIDDGGNLFKSESTWSLHVSNYQEVTFTSVYECGNYQILEDNESIYVETYTQRYYDDGIFQKSVECRDIMELETVESKTTNAGTFECNRIKTTYFEDEIYSGYSLDWITEDGTLVQERVVDEDGSTSLEMSLISESEPPVDLTFLVLLLAFVIIGGGVIAFYIYKRQTSPSNSSQQSMTRPGYSYTKTCPKCGASIRPLYKFCDGCGSKLEN